MPPKGSKRCGRGWVRGVAAGGKDAGKGAGGGVAAGGKDAGKGAGDVAGNGALANPGHSLALELDQEIGVWSKLHFLNM